MVCVYILLVCNVADKDIKTEEKKFKTEPVNTEIKSSEAARTVVKSERVIEIYRKTGPIKRENSPSYGGTLDLDARENGKKENTEQVSNNGQFWIKQSISLSHYCSTLQFVR